MNATIQVQVDNIKCGGCERSIRRGLEQIDGVAAIEIDRDQQVVRVDAPAATRPQVVDKLAAMGYPERGSVQGLGAGLATAKSFVSCAIGRMR